MIAILIGEEGGRAVKSTQILHKEYIQKKICPLFFVIDNSGSMACMGGAPIRKLNKAMEELIQQLIGINQRSDYEIRIAIMTFNSSVVWHTDGLVSPNSIKWEDMYAEGVTAWGKALTTLDHALSRFGLLTESVGYTRPIIIFTTDGFPTDEVEGPIARILQNKWFKISTKAAIAIDVVGLDSFLERITGDKDTVYFFYKAQPFEELLKNMCLSLVTTVGLMIGSKTTLFGFRLP